MTTASEHENTRLEAFCDGVFAIALTLLIVDIKLPETGGLTTTADMWRALAHVAPSVFAFLLSFIIIYVTWVNHHNALKLVRTSTPSFIYANGLLLLTVVFIPFPTSLLGGHLFTDHAAPAVVLYNAVLSLQAVSWAFLAGTAMRNQLPVGKAAEARMRLTGRRAYPAIVLYGALAVAALWLPRTVAAVTTATWVVWLSMSLEGKT